MKKILELRYWSNNEGSKRMYITTKTNEKYVKYMKRSEKDKAYNVKSDCPDEIWAEAKCILDTFNGGMCGTLYANQIEAFLSPTKKETKQTTATQYDSIEQEYKDRNDRGIKNYKPNTPFLDY